MSSIGHYDAVAHAHVVVEFAFLGPKKVEARPALHSSKACLFECFCQGLFCNGGVDCPLQSGCLW
eukprot:11199400-Lingulodinium_polyedra.AAC.1